MKVMMDSPCIELVTARLKNFIAMADLWEQLSYLTSEQVEDDVQLVGEHKALFKDASGLTHVLTHDIDTGNAHPITQYHPGFIPANGLRWLIWRRKEPLTRDQVSGVHHWYLCRSLIRLCDLALIFVGWIVSLNLMLVMQFVSKFPKVDEQCYSWSV